MSTRLQIKHTTLYQYTKPTRFGQHRLILRPRESHDLQVESMDLEVKPDCQTDWSRDVFGNSVATVDFLDAATELSIVNRVAVRRGTPPRATTPNIAPIPYPVIYEELERLVVAAYQTSIYLEEQACVRNWLASSALLVETADAMTRVTAINEAIYKGIRYKRREVKGVQRPSETLADRSGSCRDMATLLMEACRALGIAARFSSGYLDCTAARTGVASTHAWTEVYFPALGWVGFDPTLGARTSFRHISVGVSNHPRGVMPVSGRFYGNSLDYVGMKVSVEVQPLDNGQSSAPDLDPSPQCCPGENVTRA